MCIEVKAIKESHNYDFSSLLILETDTPKTENEKNKQIEEIATNLLENILKNDKTIEPISGNIYATPIIGISQHFGFINCRGDFKNLPDELKEYKNALGMISINGDNKEHFGSDKILILDPNENLGCKRFTIAHELGHYLFDFNELTNFQYEDFYRPDDTYINPKEIRASRFAAAILMPINKFVSRYNELNTENSIYFEIVNQLSQDFLVPTSAVDRRIKELKLFLNTHNPQVKFKF